MLAEIKECLLSDRIPEPERIVIIVRIGEL